MESSQGNRFSGFAGLSSPMGQLIIADVLTFLLSRLAAPGLGHAGTQAAAAQACRSEGLGLFGPLRS